MATKDNMFAASFRKRALEQEKTQAELTGQKQAGGRPKKRDDGGPMTIYISRADKELVKAYAFSQALSVSDLIHRWINEHCSSSGAGLPRGQAP